MLQAWAGVSGRPPRGLRRHVGIAPDADAIDALWLRARAQLTAATVRDARALVDRYGPAGAGESAYVWVSVSDRVGLTAVGTVRRPRADGDPRLRGVRVATLSDLLFPADREDAGLAVLAAAEDAARDLGADALLCSASAPVVGRLLRARAYLPLAGNVHFLLRDELPGAAWPGRITDWWLTRGDGEADGVF